MRNVNSCLGPACGTDETMEISQAGGSRLVLKDVLFEENVHRATGDIADGNNADCDEILETDVKNRLDATNVRFVRNSSRCVGFDCDVDEIWEVNNDSTANGGQGSLALLDDIWFIDNENICTGAECDIDEILETNPAFVSITDLTMTGNLMRCSGDVCDTDAIWDTSSGKQHRLSRITVSNNVSEGFGAVTDDSNPENGDQAIIEFDGQNTRGTNITVADNQVTCVGSQCARTSVLTFQRGAKSARLTGLQLQGNTVTCSLCDNRLASVVSNWYQELRLGSCQISGNSTDGFGGGIANFTDLLLDDCDVNENTAEVGAGLFNFVTGRAFFLDTDVFDNQAGVGAGVLNLGLVNDLGGSAIFNNVNGDCVDAGSGTGCF